MKCLLSERLQEHEEILWEGVPQNIKLFENSYHTIKAIIGWCVAAAFVFFAIQYYFFTAPSLGIPTGQAIGISAVALLCGGYLAVAPFLNLHIMQTRTHYCITNQRFISYMISNSDGVYKFLYRDLADITEVNLETLSTGKITMYVGPNTPYIRRHSRDEIREYREEEKMDPIAFCSIDDPYGACESLPTFIKIIPDILKGARRAA